MKNVLLLLAFFIGCLTNINGQDFPTNEMGEIEFVEVVETSLSKDKLYANAKEWVAKTFGDYKSVIQFEDDSNKKLIIKGISPIDFTSATVKVDNFVGMSSTEELDYTITIECKDNKYRYIVDNINVFRTYKILGSPVKSKPFSPTKNLQDIISRKAELEKLESINTSKLKKKELEKHNNQIDLIKRSINEAEIFYRLEFETMKSLVESLKRSIIIDNDF